MDIKFTPRNVVSDEWIQIKGLSPSPKNAKNRYHSEK
jgi:hypothetical protein